MKRIYLCILVFLIAGCNKDKDSNIEFPIETPVLTEEQQIELDLKLPKEPDPIENNATRLGVDENEDKVRDDVERVIGFAFPKDEAARNYYRTKAVLWTEILENDGNSLKQRELIDAYVLHYMCELRDYVKKSETTNNLGNLLYATSDSIIYYNRLISEIYGISPPKPTDKEIHEYCKKF